MIDAHSTDGTSRSRISDGAAVSDDDDIFSPGNVTSAATGDLGENVSTSTVLLNVFWEGNGSQTTGGNWMTRHPVIAPDWKVAGAELKWTWLLHTYGFACLFFMLAFYSFFSILNLRAQLSTRPYMSSINVFLCLLGISRAICFLIDPYNSKGIMPETIGSILWALAFPCLISAFGLIQMAFLQLTQLKLGPSKIRSKSCMSLVVTTHFCLTIATNILWTFQHDVKMGLYKVFCYVFQTTFICWGLFLCATFLYGGWQMLRMLQHAPPSLFQRSDSSGFENKVLALGLLANCHNLAAMTAAAAAAVPSFMAAPKIRITDENEQTYSYVSDNSHVSSNQNLHVGEVQENHGVDSVSACRMSPRKKAGSSGGGVYMVSEDVNPFDDTDMEHTRMLQKEEDGEAGGQCTTRAEAKSGDKIGSGLLGVMRSNGQMKRNCSRNGSGSSGAGARHKNDNLEMSLLPCTEPTANGGKVVKQDLTLMSILNHIAYVNAADDCKFEARKLKPTRKTQIERVLQGTYASAALGFLLCVLETYRLYGPYGISAGAKAPTPWPWFIFQTICRFLELLMGCFMANITKQPVNRHHHYPYSCHMKHRGGGLYF